MNVSDIKSSLLAFETFPLVDLSTVKGECLLIPLTVYGEAIHKHVPLSGAIRSYFGAFRPFLNEALLAIQNEVSQWRLPTAITDVNLDRDEPDHHLTLVLQRREETKFAMLAICRICLKPEGEFEFPDEYAPTERVLQQFDQTVVDRLHTGLGGSSCS